MLEAVWRRECVRPQYVSLAKRGGKMAVWLSGWVRWYLARGGAKLVRP